MRLLLDAHIWLRSLAEPRCPLRRVLSLIPITADDRLLGLGKIATLANRRAHRRPGSLQFIASRQGIRGRECDSLTAILVVFLGGDNPHGVPGETTRCLSFPIADVCVSPSGCVS